jgi:aconitate hydratase
MLRKAKVVGKFVEFFGRARGIARRGSGNNCEHGAEYGATMGFFPLMGVRQLPACHGRSDAHCQMYENYYKAQKALRHASKGQIQYSVELDLDLASVVRVSRDPNGRRSRIELPNLKQEFIRAFSNPVTGKWIWQRT